MYHMLHDVGSAGSVLHTYRMMTVQRGRIHIGDYVTTTVDLETLRILYKDIGPYWLKPCRQKMD